jgi:hypothetical protein
MDLVTVQKGEGNGAEILKNVHNDGSPRVHTVTK